MYRMFQKKVKCEFCNEEFNRTFLSKHIKRCLIEMLHLNDNKIISINDENIINNNNENNTAGTEGVLPASSIMNNNDENNNDEMKIPEASKAVIER